MSGWEGRAKSWAQYNLGVVACWAELRKRKWKSSSTVHRAMCNVHALEANLLKAGRMQIITWLYGTTAYFLDHTLGFLKPGKVKIENESLPTDREGSGAAHTHEQMIWSQPFSAAFLFIRFTNHLFRKKPCKISTKKEVNHWAHEVVKSAWH